MGGAPPARPTGRSAGSTLQRVASRSRSRGTHVLAVAGPLENVAVPRGSRHRRSAPARGRLRLVPSSHIGRVVDHHQALAAMASWPKRRT